MDEDPEFDLVEDNYEDQEFDDCPLSDNGSNFDHEELRSVCDEDFAEEARGAPPGRQRSDLSTIAEEDGIMHASIVSARTTTQKDNRNVKNDTNDSDLQFNPNTHEIIDNAEKNFFADKAETMFIRDDPRFEELNYDKENSWEPSLCQYNQAVQSPAEHNKMVVHDENKTRVFGAKSTTTTFSPLGAPSHLEVAKQPNRQEQVARVPPVANPSRFIPTAQPTASSTRYQPVKVQRAELRPAPVAQSRKPTEQKSIVETTPEKTNEVCRMPGLEKTIFTAANEGMTSTPKRNQQGKAIGFLDISSIRGSPAGVRDVTAMTETSLSETYVRNVLSGNDSIGSLGKRMENVRQSGLKKMNLPQTSKSTKRMNIMKPVLAALEERSESVVSMREDCSRPSSSRSMRSDISRQSTASQRADANETMKSRNSYQKKAEEVPRTNSVRVSQGRSGMSDVSTRMERVSVASSRQPDRTVTLRKDPYAQSSMTSAPSMTSTVGSSLPTNNSNVISFAPARISFGNVPIGDSMSADLTMKNNTNKPMTIRVSVDRDCKFFRLNNNRLYYLDAGQSACAQVEFSPIAVGLYQVSVNVEIKNMGCTKTVSLAGWGGMANVQPVLNDSLMTTVNKEFVLRTNTISKFSFELKNSGEREAFVDIGLYDSMMRQMQATIDPAYRFCLPKRGVKKVDIRIPLTASREESVSRMSTMSSASSSRGSYSRADYAVIIYWGEENMRQRVKELELKTNKKQQFEGRSFTDSPFLGEQIPKHGAKPTVPSVRGDDLRLFNFGLRRTTILVHSNRVSHCAIADPNVSMWEDTVIQPGARLQTFIQDPDSTIIQR